MRMIKLGLLSTLSAAMLIGCSTQSENEQENSEESNSSIEAIEEAEAPKEVRISAVGDVIGHSPVYRAADPNQSHDYNFDSMFKYVTPIFEESDVNLVNLETTLTDDVSEISGYPYFITPKELINGLSHAGFNGIITANNHSMDNSIRGIEETIKWTEDADLPAIGTSLDTHHQRYHIEKVGDLDVAVLAFTEFVNGHGTSMFTEEEMYKHINMLTDETIHQEVEAVKEYDPDIIIAYAHWGEEYTEELTQNQLNFAEVFAEAGVDAVIGSHPHVIQKAEMIEHDDHEMFIIYSVGNFLSNQRVESLGESFRPSEDGVIVHLDYEQSPDGEDVKLKNVEFTPTWVNRKLIEEALFEYYVLPTNEHTNDQWTEEEKNRMQSSGERTKSRLQFENERQDEQ